MNSILERLSQMPAQGDINDVEVMGIIIKGFVDLMGFFKTKAMEILAIRGIDKITENEWYPLESLLLIFDPIIAMKKNAFIEQIGIETVNNAPWPPYVQTFADALQATDISYHMHHRRNGQSLFDPASGNIIEGGIGHVVAEPMPDKDNAMLCFSNTFYPTDFDKGIIKGLWKKYNSAIPMKDLQEIRPERGKSAGGSSSVYVISW